MKNKSTGKRLEKIFEFAKNNSAFYKKHFKKFNTVSALNFYKLPFLESKHLYKNTPPNGIGLLSGPAKNCYVLITGGTAKKPKYVFRSMEDFKEKSKYFKGIKLKPSDRVANLFSAGMWGGFISWNKSLEEAGCLIAPLGHVSLEPENIEATLKIMKDLKINTLFGVPTTIIRFAQYLEKKGNKAKKSKIEKILTGGELITKDMQKYLSKVFKGALIRSLYATTETAVIGFQCERLKTNRYHIFDNQYLEIVDPQTGKPTEKGRTGEIVVTNLDKRLMPVVRFKTGDIGRLTEKKCKCDYCGKTLELFGRLDSTLCIEGTNVPLNAVSEAITSFPRLSQNFQMVARKKNKKDQLLVKIETNSKKVPTALARKVKSKINKNISESLSNIEVEIVAENSLPKNKTSGKIARVADKRRKVF